jgi:peptide deformylase
MLFNQEMDEVRNKPSSVEFQTPLKIQLYPAKCLRMKNEQVTVFDDKLKDLAQQMFKIMYETDGCGLAAPQVGVNYRLMVYNESGRPDEGKEVVLVNPKISKYSNQKDFFEEGCLSFPEINAEVERPMGVKIEAQDIEGKKFKMTLEGFEARVFQHEYDHLDGVLFHDRMSSVVIGTIRNDLDKLIKDFGDDENEKAI